MPRVSDLITYLQKDFKPDDFIAYVIITKEDIAKVRESPAIPDEDIEDILDIVHDLQDTGDTFNYFDWKAAIKMAISIWYGHAQLKQDKMEGK